MKKLLSLGIITFSTLALVACSQDTKEATSSPENKTEQATTTKTEKADDSIPTEYKTAVKKATQYADTVHLSKEGLRTQLVDFEKFSQEAADYAVENANIDYKQQAVEKAKQYQETVAMSPEAIRGQLVDFEKFTQEEADYAVENLE